MSDKIIEIEIYGQKYKIKVKGEEDEKYIGHLTSYVDQKMREVAVKSRSIDMIKIAVDWDGHFIFDTSRPDGAPRKILDVSRMRSILDWEPKTSIQEGITKTVEWYIENNYR